MSDLERQSQFEKALSGLRSLVLSGEFEANSRLPETALADRLGISRTPLRQAMDRLIAEGLLERLESGGCRVASFSVTDVIDSIELRGVLEGTAARLAAAPARNDSGPPIAPATAAISRFFRSQLMLTFRVVAKSTHIATIQ